MPRGNELNGTHRVSYEIDVTPTYYFSGQPEPSPGHRLAAASSNWLIWQHDNLVGDFNGRTLQLDTALIWNIGRRTRNFACACRRSASTPACARPTGSDPTCAPYLRARAGVNSFSVRNLGFQVRYRYQLAPLSNLYVVYSRGGYAMDPMLQSAGTQFRDSFSLRDTELFLVKLAYRFQSVASRHVQWRAHAPTILARAAEAPLPGDCCGSGCMPCVLDARGRDARHHGTLAWMTRHPPPARTAPTGPSAPDRRAHGARHQRQPGPVVFRRPALGCPAPGRLAAVAATVMRDRLPRRVRARAGLSAIRARPGRSGCAPCGHSMRCTASCPRQESGGALDGLPRCRDPDDQKFMELAHAGRCAISC